VIVGVVTATKAVPNAMQPHTLAIVVFQLKVIFELILHEVKNCTIFSFFVCERLDEESIFCKDAGLG
jgi:hypothetical protein